MAVISKMVNGRKIFKTLQCYFCKNQNIDKQAVFFENGKPIKVNHLNFYYCYCCNGYLNFDNIKGEVE